MSISHSQMLDRRRSKQAARKQMAKAGKQAKKAEKANAAKTAKAPKAGPA